MRVWLIVLGDFNTSTKFNWRPIDDWDVIICYKMFDVDVWVNIKIYI